MTFRLYFKDDCMNLLQTIIGKRVGLTTCLETTSGRQTYLLVHSSSIVKWDSENVLVRVDPVTQNAVAVTVLKENQLYSDNKQPKTIEMKPGRFLMQFIEILGLKHKDFPYTKTVRNADGTVETVQKESYLPTVEQFNTYYKGLFADSPFFISEHGDIERLLYAYDAWGGSTLSNSCMAHDHMLCTPNVDLRFPNWENYATYGEGYYDSLNEMLWDHILNIDHIRTVITYTDKSKGTTELISDGVVLARALLRDTYCDNERVGSILDRTYYYKEQYGQGLINKVLETVPDIIAVRKPTNLCEFNVNNEMFFWKKPELKNEYLYTPVTPNPYGIDMAFQDSFRYHDRATNRAYIRDINYSLRRNAHREKWDKLCPCGCGNVLVLGNNRRLLHDYYRGPDGSAYYEEACLERDGWHKCDCGCGRWTQRRYICGKQQVVYAYSEECLLKMGYIICRSCQKIHKVSDETENMIKVDGYMFCSEDCLRSHGYRKCSCGKWSLNLERISDGTTIYYVCSKDCAVKYAGLEWCNKCKTWHKVKDHVPFKVGRKKFCSERCARNAGYYPCAECGKWEQRPVRKRGGRWSTGELLCLPWRFNSDLTVAETDYWCKDCAEIDLLPCRHFWGYYSDKVGYALCSTKPPKNMKETVQEQAKQAYRSLVLDKRANSRAA